MKYTSAVLALAAATATAQDISIFPECAMPCIIDAVGTTSCETTDFACVCDNMEDIKGAATPCVVSKCGIDTALSTSTPQLPSTCLSPLSITLLLTYYSPYNRRGSPCD